MTTEKLIAEARAYVSNSRAGGAPGPAAVVERLADALEAATTDGEEQWELDSDAILNESRLSTGEVREHYLDSWDYYNDEPSGAGRTRSRGKEFDRWLAEHDRAVAATAVDAAADGIYRVGSVTGFLLPTVRDVLHDRADEIRQSANALVTDERTQ